MNFVATHVVNERRRPRVLVFRGLDSVSFDWVEPRAGNYRTVFDLNEVDLDEWDVLVTDQPVINTPSFGNPSRAFPDSIYTFRVVRDSGLVDFAEDPAPPGRVSYLRWELFVPGDEMKRVDGLPEPLQDLVQSELFPSVVRRQFQEGIQAISPGARLAPSIKDFRPFLIGPKGLIVAASYERHTGSRHWVLPVDAGDFGLWFDCALTEWHSTNPKLFPNHASWQQSSEWLTSGESAISQRIADEKAAFESQRTTHSATLATLEAQLAEARASGGDERRLLMTSRDDELQNAVLHALQELGFHVQDMDEKWDERAKREDFRISDGSDDWLVLADATGTTNGAKLSKFVSLTGHRTSYLELERQPGQATPGVWLIVNHLLHRDPNSRGPLFTEEIAEVIAAQNGLAIDTTALFLILESSPTPEARERARAWMRGLTGQLTVDSAREWIAR